MTVQRTAIVTGAARGIGQAIAARLASDGHAVALLDLDGAQAAQGAADIEAAGGRAVGVQVDVGDEGSVAHAVAQVTDTLGAPTILVNNAGIIRDNLLFRMTVQDWDQVFTVHLRGAFLLSRAVQSHMVDAKFGRIVNMSSLSALGNRGQANYAAAKAGLQGFTKTLALELGRFGVTANAIAPGFIETDMTRATAARMGVSFEEFSQALVKDIAVGRTGTPDDVAAATSYLVSAQAGFVSGQVLYVAGGPTD